MVCHGIPGDRVLEEGQILNVDITTILDGYFADSSRMYYVGQVDQEGQKLVETCKEAMMIGLEAIKPFTSVDTIGEAIEPFANKHGYTVVRAFGGHGIGKAFHEEPFVHHHVTGYKGLILVPGMVLTVEPMLNEGTYQCEVLEDDWTAVTKDGKRSAQWEHTVVVTEDGYEILT